MIWYWTYVSAFFCNKPFDKTFPVCSLGTITVAIKWAIKVGLRRKQLR